MNIPLKGMNKKRTRNSSVLILVLIVLSSMTILLVGLAYWTLIETKLAYAIAQRTQAYYPSLGDIEKVKALISREELSPLAFAQICQFTCAAEENGHFAQNNEFEVI